MRPWLQRPTSPRARDGPVGRHEILARSDAATRRQSMLTRSASPDLASRAAPLERGGTVSVLDAVLRHGSVVSVLGITYHDSARFL
jgi:hypothetical protein